MTGPKRTSKPKVESTAPAPAAAPRSAAAAKPPAAAMAASEPPAKAAPAAPAPAAPPPPPQPEGPNAMDNVTAALNSAMSGIMSRLNTTEQLIGLGAVIIILVTSLLTGLILNDYRPSDLVVVGALAILGLIWLQHSGRRNFGTSYKTYLLGIGSLIAALVAVSAVYQIRSGFSFLSSGGFIGLISLWVSAVLIGYGAYQLWKARA